MGTIDWRSDRVVIGMSLGCLKIYKQQPLQAFAMTIKGPCYVVEHCIKLHSCGACHVYGAHAAGF